MTAHTTIIVDWLGPYSQEEIEEKKELANGLYLVTGKLKYERSATIQYCGITEGAFFRRFRNHHKIHQIYKESEFWLGSIKYPSESSRHFLELAETLIIYFWQPELNTRKKLSTPNSITLISKWFKTNYQPRLRQHTLCKDLDDVLSWDGSLWRTGNLQVWSD